MLMAEEGEVYYVQAPRAAVVSRPSFDSQVWGELVRGQKFLGVIQGSWLKLRYKGNDGYVPYILVAPHPPLERKDLKSRMAPKEHFKTRISFFPPEAAEEKSQQGKEPEGGTGGNRPDNEALRAMESFVPSEDEIQKFTEEEDDNG
jgi:hypothetical protein